MKIVLIKMFKKIHRSDLERAFKHTNSTLSEMTQSNWIIDYGENSKERILLNLR